MPFRVALLTLGCKVNQADSEALAAEFAEAGCHLVEPDQPADAYVVNTCTVTLVADRKARKLVRGVASPNPDALVAVCGCYAEGLGPALLEKLPEVDVMRGTSDRGSLPAAVLLELRRRQAAGLLAPLDGPLAAPERRVRALLKVQDGCSQSCAYCIVPSVRGGLASRQPAAVRAEAAARLAGGARELVVCGIRLGAYGLDWATPGVSRYEPLRALVEELAALDGLARLRLGSILPIDANPGLFATLAASPRGCPHLHLPLQSGDDGVLRSMDRRYDTARFRRVVDEARAALGNPALASDVMVGFPGETTAAFEQTMAFCAEIGFADLHIFAYSPRPGTRAARWPDDVPPAEKAARARALADLRDSLWQEYHSPKLQTEVEVLIEQSDPDQAEVVGLTADYLRVRAKVDPARPGVELGALVRVRLASLDSEAGYGQVVANT